MASEPSRTVLVATVAVPAHTYNATPFVARLLGDGHRVLWYADRRHHDHISRTGAHPICPSGTPEAVGERLDRLADVRHAYEREFVGSAGRRFTDLRAVMDRDRVDVLLTDSLAYGAGAAAESAGLPWASFGDGPMHYPEVGTPPFGTGLPRVPGWPWDLRNVVVSAISGHVIFGRAARRHQAWRRSVGLTRTPGSILEANLSPYLHLHGATPGFEYPRPHLPGHVHWVGALRPEPPARWVRPAWWGEVTAPGSRPLVLVSQGTIRGDVSELIRPSVLGLAGHDVTVLVTTGSADPAEVVGAVGGRLPDTVIVERFVPYDAVLPFVDVFVTNGGYTGVTLALAHGVPLVQAGVTEEKADIGARIAYSGTGIRLGARSPEPERVREAVLAALGASRYRTAASRVAAEMRAHDAGAEGAALLLKLARTRRPVLRSAPPCPGDQKP